MPWVPRRKYEELEKAGSRVPPGARSVGQQVDMIARAQGVDPSRRMDSNSQGRLLFRPDEWVTSEFAPAWPLPYEPLNFPRPDTGMPDPRQWQYPVSENLRYFNEKPVSWDTLRQTAETPLFRACIEIKKAELSTLDWKIQVNEQAVEDIARKTRQAKETVESALRERYENDIQRLTAFWSMPDRRNGRDFQEWISIAFEEQLVWDAIAVYPWRNMGGSTEHLLLLDGSTIKPLIDELGMRPEPPAPAYQQVLYGFPRGEFTADMVDQDGQAIVPGGLLATQLIYRRRVPRLRTPYGFSCTEQALLDGLLYNKRFQWMLAEYTEGTLTPGWMKIPESGGYSARQILEMERKWNDRFSGMSAERYRTPFPPPGFELMETKSVEERYKRDYDLYLIGLVAMHFGLTVTELGFTESGGLGSTGYHEGQEDIQFRKGLLPDTRWFANFLTQISVSQLGMPPELEFAFLGLDDEDEAAADQVNENRVRSGRMTINEARVAAGLPAVNIAEADMLQVMTQRGTIFEDGASKLVPAGVLIEPASEKEGINSPSGSGSGVVGGASSIAPKAIKPKATKVKKSEPVAKHDGTRSVGDEVYAQLADDYPRGSIEWVHNASWTGPEPISLDQIEWDTEKFDAAAGNPDKVDKFAAKIQRKEADGKHPKPVVTVLRPGNSARMVPDGHHRALAYKTLGEPIWGYTGHVSHATGPWDRMHDDQFQDEQHEVQKELAAFRRWAAKHPNGNTRPFRFEHVDPAKAPEVLVSDPRVVFAKAGGVGPKA